MYIKENITIDLLNKNGVPVNTELSVFVQDTLNKKYNFIPLYKDNIEYINTLDKIQFSTLMYMFNSLIDIENMEFDHSCFNVQKDSNQRKNTLRIPQDNGYDIIISGGVYPVFVKSPSFMIKNIVHPVSYETKTIYLKLIYMLLNDPYTNIDILLPFGETVKNIFLNESKKQSNFSVVIDKLILSQFPTFKDYFKSIFNYLKETLPFTLEPTSIKDFKISTSKTFNNSIFNNLTDKYNPAIIEKYDKYIDIEKINALYDNNLYAYPRVNDSVIYPYNEEISYQQIQSLARIAFNCEIYIQVLNRVMPESFKENKIQYTSILEKTYKVKKVYYSIIKAFYFSYHMSFNKVYGSLYNNDSFKFQPAILLDKHVIYPLKTDVYYPVWTLNQCNSIIDKETLLKLVIKTVWHNDKFLIKKIEGPIKRLLKENSNDMYIFKGLNSLYKQFKPKETGFNKGDFRYKELKDIGIFDGIDGRDMKYLDFGGGIGDIGASIAKNVGFLKQNSYVTDIQNWLGKEHTEEYSKYITYRYLKSNDLPFENKSIDFITCFQVLHHIADKEYTLTELKRILKEDGELLIREHNCENNQDRMLIDLEHSLHAFVVDEQGQDYLQNYNDNYMSKTELDNLMKKTGFSKVTKTVFPKDKGITKYYYSLWKVMSSKKEDSMFKKNWADYSSDED
jgi:ubiquinone/menaquinone biosynthesis C-methylase UbiE